MKKNTIPITVFLENAFKTAAILCACTAINALFMKQLDTSDSISELYILGVLLISLNTTGYIWGIIGAVAGVLCVNYFFTYPYINFNFTLDGYPITFLVMLTIAVATSALSGRVKKQREFAREHSRLTEERQTMLIEAEREKMRGNLLRAISHDLRTPLTGIIGAAGALIDNDELIDSKSRKELLSGISEDAQWLLRMVENVLSVTRISGGAPSLKKVSQSLDEVFAQVASKARKRYPSIKLTLKLPQNVTMVPMDEMLIVQVIINLIDNSIIHGGNNDIELSAVNNNDSVLISLRDHGKGIPPNDLDNVFEGFSARDKNCTDSTRGLGIGLSICKTIVEGHGGAIFAQNTPDGGACLSFTLPTEEVNNYAE